LYRGHKARVEVNALKADAVQQKDNQQKEELMQMHMQLQLLDEEQEKQDMIHRQQQQSAISIQKLYRGHKARVEVKLKKVKLTNKNEIFADHVSKHHHQQSQQRAGEYDDEFGESLQDQEQIYQKIVQQQYQLEEISQPGEQHHQVHNQLQQLRHVDQSEQFEQHQYQRPNERIVHQLQEHQHHQSQDQHQVDEHQQHQQYQKNELEQHERVDLHTELMRRRRLKHEQVMAAKRANDQYIKR
jgi:hypothetical protein